MQSDSDTGSSELSLPTGSESGDSSSEDESMQALRIRSLGPIQKETRTDPKPGEVTPKDLVRREVWFYFDVEQQLGISQACSATPHFNITR